ncbi:MAG: ParB N-terminal domain-containing protein [Halobacteriovoraceae bacterium]|jgi:ParB family transcriptional regulator, chromosome partitioning protein|nr:ParB N-terminal domain-containing protein [Halobacteriovoraceae bacterium]
MQEFDISIIKTHNKYLRLDTNVDMLKKSIETVGLINPIVINENDELIAGGRRFQAMKELGYTKVLAVRVNKNEMEQELISIDENLVRKDLTNIELEQSLSRGKELYETLYPDVKRFKDEVISTIIKEEIDNETPNDKKSFLDITSEKTGLSKKVIKSAIDREERASKKVKELRALGELNASQTNEIIKLAKEDQEYIADFMTDKSAKEVKQIVKMIDKEGLENSMEDIKNAPHLPNEYKSFKTLLNRINKIIAKILIEEINSEHDDKILILEQVQTLKTSLDQFILLATSSGSEQYDYSQFKDEAIAVLSKNNASKPTSFEGQEHA